MDSMKDRVSAKERLSNSYLRQIMIDAFWAALGLSMVILFVYQVVIDIVN